MPHRSRFPPETSQRETSSGTNETYIARIRFLSTLPWSSSEASHRAHAAFLGRKIYA
jgi:hypothetical protein